METKRQYVEEKDFSMAKKKAVRIPLLNIETFIYKPADHQSVCLLIRMIMLYLILIMLLTQLSIRVVDLTAIAIIM
jgi:hypothetical protein